MPTFSCVAASRLALCVGDDAGPAASALGSLAAAPRAHPTSAAALAALAALAAVLLAPHADPAVALFYALAVCGHTAPRDRAHSGFDPLEVWE